MKKQFLKISLLLTVFLLISCGKSGININTPEGINETKKTTLEKFDPEKEVYNLTILSEGDIKTQLGSVYIGYLDDKIMYTDTYTHFIPKPTVESKKNNVQGETFIRNKKGKVKIKDLNFDIIIEKYNEGVKLIGDEYSDFALASWSFKVDNNNKVTYYMEITATKKGEGTSLEGRNIVTNYYEFEFDIDENGKLEPRG